MITGGLRALLASDGDRRFLRGPMLVPETRSFPDPWSPDAEGVHRLIRRIMQYAGLAAVPCAVERFVYDGDPGDGDGAQRGRHVVAFFEGVHDGVCRFGVNCAQLGDPEFLIGVLAHEVAHAYRAIHGLVVEDRDAEEELTDLTTVFLGFGVFTTNNAHRTRRHHGSESTRSGGYLPPQVMALALATWTHARAQAGDADVAERWLEPMQRGMFVAALSRLDRRAVAARLGVAGLRPEAVTTGRVPSEALHDAPLLARDAEPIDFAAKRGETFRVQVRAYRWAVPMGLLFALVLAPSVSVSTVQGIAIVVVGAQAGWTVGRALSYDHCARWDCGTRIPPEAACCPSCGAVVRGVLPKGMTWSEAEEMLRQDRLKERRARRAS